MKIEEFRIGNYVELQIDLPEIKTKEVSRVLKIEYESSDLCCFSENIPDCDFWDLENEEVKPIELTEEWLIKFGFNLRQLGKDKYFSLKINEYFYIYSNPYGSGLTSSEIECDCGECSDEFDVMTGLKHVHSLQNLYFAITGTELKLNDK